MKLLNEEELRRGVQRDVERVSARWMRGSIDQMFLSGLTHRSTVTASPIEQLFYAAWELLDPVMGQRCDGFSLILTPQVQVETHGHAYRLDFAVTYVSQAEQHVIEDAAFPRIGIELDGHDFHERTREQVELRNRRDRHLAAAGWKVFHYAGSEVRRSPGQCVSEVALFAIEHGDKAFYRMVGRQVLRGLGMVRAS